MSDANLGRRFTKDRRVNPQRERDQDRKKKPSYAFHGSIVLTGFQPIGWSLQL